MQKLINTITDTVKQQKSLPFSIYRANQEQRMLNVPVIKPLLIFVLSGNKTLGSYEELNCCQGSFVFLSNTPKIAMRNIPNKEHYFALLIEFEYSDFDGITRNQTATESYFQGDIEQPLADSLQQFVEWSAFAPKEMWHLRRREILHLLLALGFQQVGSIMEPPTLSHKVYTAICQQLSKDLSATKLSAKFAMSESSLRRKLSAEGTSLQTIKDQAKLDHGLHLLQSSFEPIGLIAEKCGYSSQSRFTEKFKNLFGITPSALRKTRMSESGE